MAAKVFTLVIAANSPTQSAGLTSNRPTPILAPLLRIAQLRARAVSEPSLYCCGRLRGPPGSAPRAGSALRAHGSAAQRCLPVQDGGRSAGAASPPAAPARGAACPRVADDGYP